MAGTKCFNAFYASIDAFSEYREAGIGFWDRAVVGEVCKRITTVE